MDTVLVPKEVYVLTELGTTQVALPVNSIKVSWRYTIVGLY